MIWVLLLVLGVGALHTLFNRGPPGAKGEMSTDFWLNLELDYAEDQDHESAE